MGYSHRNWACPYYRSDKPDRVYCYGGTIKFPDRKSLIEYANKYCGKADSWSKCSVAAAWTDYIVKTGGTDGQPKNTPKADPR